MNNKVNEAQHSLFGAEFTQIIDGKSDLQETI